MSVCPEFNLLDPDCFAHGHPHAAYDRLRSESPVALRPGSESQPPYWLLSRYDDIRAVSVDAKRFTSSRGFRIQTDSRAAMDPEIARVLGRFVLSMDDPEHAAFRSLVSAAFMPSGVAKVVPRVQASIAGLLESLKDRDEVEFVSEVGAAVPIQTVCALLGVPLEDEWRVFEFTNAVFGTDDPELTASIEVANERYLAIFDYGWWLLEQRRAEPKDDLLSLIAHGTVNGRPLDKTEQISFFSNAIAAGNETTRSSFSGAMWAFWTHRDQRRLVVEQPELRVGAMQEVLRWFSPVFQMARTALCDVEVGGTLIREGERVAMLYGAANHDPAVFADPHALDIRRANANRHVTFGYGIHHCLGARLAPMQLGLLMNAILDNFPDYELLAEPVYIRSNFVGAMKRLPVRLRG